MTFSAANILGLKIRLCVVCTQEDDTRRYYETKKLADFSLNFECREK